MIEKQWCETENKKHHRISGHPPWGNGWSDKAGAAGEKDFGQPWLFLSRKLQKHHQQKLKIQTQLHLYPPALQTQQQILNPKRRTIVDDYAYQRITRFCTYYLNLSAMNIRMLLCWSRWWSYSWPITSYSGMKIRRKRFSFWISLRRQSFGGTSSFGKASSLNAYTLKKVRQWGSLWWHPPIQTKTSCWKQKRQQSWTSFTT